MFRMAKIEVRLKILYWFVIWHNSLLKVCASCLLGIPTLTRFLGGVEKIV